MFVVTPLLVVQVAAFAAERPARRTSQGVPLMNSVLIGFLALLVLLVLPWIKPHLGLPPQLGPLLAPTTPVAAVEYMQQTGPRAERLFHSVGSGSYLIWAAPDQPVFIDTRIELYPLDQWQDYIRLSTGEDVTRLVKQYRFDGMLLDNELQANLLEQVRDDPAWEVQYEDGYTTYLVQR
jgi:hypothetical protein